MGASGARFCPCETGGGTLIDVPTGLVVVVVVASAPVPLVFWANAGAAMHNAAAAKIMYALIGLLPRSHQEEPPAPLSVSSGGPASPSAGSCRAADTPVARLRVDLVAMTAFPSAPIDRHLPTQAAACVSESSSGHVRG